MTGYAHPEVLVDTQWVSDHVSDPAVRLVEVGFNMEAYDSGHAPGAVGWSWQRDFQHPVRRDLPDKAGAEALFARSGIGNDTTVVFYGDLNNWYATFAFWLLKIYGHRDARIVNGSRKKYGDEGRPMTTERPTITPTTYVAREPDGSIRALRDRVLESIGRADRMLVDVRSPEEYHGQLVVGWSFPNEGAQRGGHIPGAVNIPWNWALEEDGTFKPAEELHALYSGAGITPDKEATIYCVIGGRSNQTWFVLTQLLGYPKVRLYDGSWAEWGILVGVPIEK